MFKKINVFMISFCVMFGLVGYTSLKEVYATTETGSWSGGNIPGRTVTMYPHYEDSNYDYSEIGYYVTYDGKNQKLLDTYGETVGVLDGEINNLTSRITTAKPTTTTYARSQMTWIYENGASLSCYLIQEINHKNQTRLRWRF